MKYQVKSDGGETNDDFEILEVKVIKERTRARIVSWTVFVWLAILFLSAVLAAVTRHNGDLQMILGCLTPLVTMAFGWYLGKQSK